MGNIDFPRHSISIAVLMAIALTASACGGGGGGTVQSTGTATVSAPATNSSTISGPPYSSFSDQDDDADNFAATAAGFETSEYEGMGGLAAINASSAYARGATGEGVTVGVIDSGVYEQHIEFSTASGDKVSYAGSDYGGANPRTDEAVSHGTLVAGVIAANRDNNLNSNVNMHGVAYEANILAFEIPLGSGDGPYEPLDETSLTFGDDNYFADRFTTMANQVDIVNMSFGFSGVVTSYNPAAIENALGNTIDALRQQNKAQGDRSIFVISAGNAFGDMDEFNIVVDASSPELLPGLPYLFPELQNHMIAVAAVDRSGAISSYSNHCGVAASFCLAAPGGGDANGDGDFADNELILSPASPPPDAEAGENYYGLTIGTSFAAPLVSGSLALLKQLFPTVGNHELVNRLLETANKNGIYADSSIYGQGLLDLDAATRPVGAISSATGASLDNGMVNPAQTGIAVFGGALGQGLSQNLSQFQVAVFDQLGFPFQQSASSMVQSVSAAVIPTPLSHGSQNIASGGRLQLGVASDPWQRSFRTTGNPNDQVQADYFALHFQDQRGSEQFAGLNANPGWFFGVYGDGVLTPGSTEDDSSFAAPWLRYARQGWSSGGAMALGSGSSKLRLGLFNGTASWNQWQPSSDQHSSGALLEYALLSGANGLSIQAGFIQEQNSFLGTSIGSALGSVESGDTFFTGINGYLQLGAQWQAIVALYSGKTDSGLNSQFISIDQKISSNSWAFGLRGNSLLRNNDQLNLYLSQPLRIEDGAGQLRVASGRTIDRQVIYQDLHFDLQPQGREQQLELSYHRPWQLAQKAAWLSASAGYIYQPEHSDLRPSQFEMRIAVSIAID